MAFKGYQRQNGSVGIRNHVVVIPTINCANKLAYEIADGIKNAVPLVHNHACIRLGLDLKRARKTLIGMGSNPNIYAVLIVGIGCETIKAEFLAEKIYKTNKNVKFLTIESEKNYEKLVKKGKCFLKKMVREASLQKRASCDLKKLTVGIKCGGSNTISAIASNPATGKAADQIIENGGKVIFSETAELIGAEHILAERAENEKVAEKLLNCVNKMKIKIEDYGLDILGSEPTEGNIKGGLTTIEEKSLGAIIKAGSKNLKDVLNYAQKPKNESGLYFMDGTTQASQLFLGMFAAGVNIQLFSFGGGLPACSRSLPSYPPGLITLPVIKILCSPQEVTQEKHFDVYSKAIVSGNVSIEEFGEDIFHEIIQVANGKLTLTECQNNYREMLQFYAEGLLM